MRIEHLNFFGDPLDMTDFDPFWTQLKRAVEQVADRVVIDDVIDLLEGEVREVTYRQLKRPLMHKLMNERRHR